MPIEWVSDEETMPRAATGVGLPDVADVPSFSDVAGAAFRQESVVGAAVDMLSKPQWFKPEEGYNPIADIEGTPYLRDHADAFVVSQSSAQTQSIKARIDRETKDRETIAAAGFSGIVASVAAGTLDPTILLPGMITVKGARGVSAAKTALATGAAVGAGAAVQEGVLQADQATRTTEESLYGVAGATILGGILGGAAGTLSRREFDALATRLEDVARGAAAEGASARAGSAGAAATADARGTGELADALGLQKLRAVTNLSPVTRLQASEFDAARNTVRDIADAGLELAENAEGIPTSVGGTIENRVKMHNGGLGKAIAAMDENYARYFYKKETISPIEAATIAPRETWARLTGALGDRMTAREFREEIGKAMIRGDEHPIPEVAAAAKAYRREVFDPLKRLAEDVGVLAKNVETDTAQTYLTRVYNHEKIIAQRDDFTGRLVQHFEATQPLEKALSREEIRALAEEVTDTILGNASRLPGIDIVAGPRGPLKERTLKIPDEKIEDFLEKDVERVARIYTRTMAADVELAKKFGDVRMDGPLATLRDEKNAKIARAGSEKERIRIEREYQRANADLEALRDRIRGTYRMPDDARAMTYRAAKVLMHLNYMRQLGGMTVSALTDIGRPVMRYGLTTTFRDGFVPLVTNFKAMRLAADEVKAAGTALDMVLENRTQAMADLFDDFQRGSKFERAVEYGAAKFGMIALMSPWNAAGKQIVGTIAMSEILRAARAVDAGTATKRQIKNLAAAGIDDSLARRIAGEFDKSGAVDGGVMLPNTEDWTDRIATEAFRSAVVREVDNVIVTPGLEKPLWTSSTLGRLVGQFKSFGLASTQRILMAGLQQKDANLVSGVIASLGLGAMVYALKSQVRGDDEIKKMQNASIAKWAVEAVDNSGLLFLPLEANNMLEKVSGRNIGLSALTGEQASRYASRGAMGAVAGPSFDALDKALQVVSAGTSAKPWSQSDTKALRQLLPLQNLFYLRKTFDEVERNVNGVLGVPMKKAN